MGLSSFPGVPSGVIPILIMSTAHSIGAVKDIAMSVLQIMGLNRNRESELTESPWPGAEAPVLGSVTAEEIRDSLPVMLFESSSVTRTECAVCLSRFSGGEEIRTLPCSHLFHKNCLDKWLYHDHITCPLCRMSLLRRRRAQGVTEELIIWFSSFHV